MRRQFNLRAPVSGAFLEAVAVAKMERMNYCALIRDTKLRIICDPFLNESERGTMEKFLICNQELILRKAA